MSTTMLGNHRLAVAPMLDWTNADFRYFARLLTRHALLYTEMVTTGALLHADPARWLDFHPSEHPIALQLAGHDPRELAACARLGENWGYDEINLNLGCPSPRVRQGRFGACLMAEPERVADCIRAMKQAVRIPVTVKTRLGIDDLDSQDYLLALLGTLQAAGADGFILHARKAWLNGLNPKENREIPPLDYPRVYAVKSAMPDSFISINGGIVSLDAALECLGSLDGVMIGRAAYQNPWLLAQADSRIFGQADPYHRRSAVLGDMLPFIEHKLSQGQRIESITRHLLGLYQGMPGGRHWRRVLSDPTQRALPTRDLLSLALAATGENL